jgi:hypothetical protein
VKPEFHQHPDDLVYIRTDAGIYADTTENFLRDFGRPLPELPPTAIERIYVQGVRHAISDGANIIEGGPMPWPLGDEIIALVDRLISKQTTRLRSADAE